MRVSPRAAPCRAYYLFLWLCFCVFVVPFFLSITAAPAAPLRCVVGRGVCAPPRLCV